MSDVINQITGKKKTKTGKDYGYPRDDHKIVDGTTAEEEGIKVEKKKKKKGK